MSRAFLNGANPMTDTKALTSGEVIHNGALSVTVAGKDRLVIETAAGQRITIQGDDHGVVIQDASGDSIHLQGGNIRIRATGSVSIQCGTVNISASTITVDCDMTKFSGAVQADTVIANTVIAASYSPGAGNVW